MTSVFYPWVDEAYRHLGVREIPGDKHNPTILGWWKAIRRGGIKSDEVAWCSAAVGGWFEAVGIESTRFEGASSWLKWGVPLPQPVVGCVVVFKRPGGWHVGIVVGRDRNGHLMVIGGNQRNAVTVAPFEMDRARGYRWPSTVPLPPFAPLPFVASNEPVSIDEA